MADAESGRRRAWTSVLVAVLALLAVLAALPGPGVVWDETFQIPASVAAGEWLFNPSQWFTGIENGWGPNHEHPSMAKLGAAFTVRLFWPVFGLVFSARLSSAILFGLLALLVYRFVREDFGERAGFLAAISLFLLPRLFGHARLAVLDFPMAFWWFFTVYAFRKGLEHRGWSVLTGVIFGAALLTKFNAVFLPLALVPWGLIHRGRRAVPNLIAMAAIAPIVFFVGWPWLWLDPIGHLGGYLHHYTGLSFLPHSAGAFVRMHLPVKYLGVVWADHQVPFHYPIVLTLVTIPIGVLAASVWGSLRGWRRARAATTVHWWNLGVSLGVFCLPGVPKYNGVRLFLYALPFVACLSGIGIAAAWQAADRLDPRRALIGLTLFLASQTMPHLWIAPYQLSYYNGLVGSTWGAARLGFEATYWWDTCNRGVFEALERLDRREQIPVRFIPDRPRFIALFTGSGRVRFQASAEAGEGYTVVLPHDGWLAKQPAPVRAFLQSQQPVHQVRYQLVPLCQVYRGFPDRRRR